MKLFHVTPKENEAIIDERGLVPRYEWVEKPHWGDPRDRYHHEPIHLSEEYPFIGFIADLCGAELVVAYEVIVADLNDDRKTKGIPLHPGIDGEGTFAVYEPIPAYRLIKIGTFDSNGKKVSK